MTRADDKISRLDALLATDEKELTPDQRTLVTLLQTLMVRDDLREVLTLFQEMASEIRNLRTELADLKGATKEVVPLERLKAAGIYALRQDSTQGTWRLDCLKTVQRDQAEAMPWKYVNRRPR